MVVIKRPLQEFEDDAEIEEMLRREAQVMSLLYHPNIVQVYDFDEINGKHYLVLEAVEGLSVARLLSAFGPLPVEIATYIATCTAEGLHAAHELSRFTLHLFSRIVQYCSSPTASCCQPPADSGFVWCQLRFVTGVKVVRAAPASFR